MRDTRELIGIQFKLQCSNRELRFENLSGKCHAQVEQLDHELTMIGSAKGLARGVEHAFGDISARNKRGLLLRKLTHKCHAQAGHTWTSQRCRRRLWW